MISYTWRAGARLCRWRVRRWGGSTHRTLLSASSGTASGRRVDWTMVPVPRSPLSLRTTIHVGRRQVEIEQTLRLGGTRPRRIALRIHSITRIRAMIYILLLYASRRRAVECNPAQVVYTRASVTRQYNLVPANGRWCSAAGDWGGSLTRAWRKVMAAYNYRRIYGFCHLSAAPPPRQTF